jgi:hypothetical protein
VIKGDFMMKRTLALLTATAIALMPGAALSAPASTPPKSGDISPAHSTRQPNQSCEDLGNQPGQTTNNSGSAFSADGTSGSKYAGEQTNINDKNTVSVSQYDVACLHNQSSRQ